MPNGMGTDAKGNIVNRHHTRRSRLVPLAVVALVVAFAVSAGAGAADTSAGRQQASETATSKATIKSLNKQLKKLTTRVGALEEMKFPGSLPPSGPARGDLTGSYPNPTIVSNAVGSTEISDNSLTGFDIADNSLYARDLAADSVGATELAFGSVGARALRSPRVVVSSGTAVPAGSARTAYAYCLTGEQVVGGGFAWLGDQTGLSIIGSTPDTSISSHAWVVTGRAASSNTLFAWALCLPA